jgi:hypothetical protein
LVINMFDEGEHGIQDCTKMCYLRAPWYWCGGNIHCRRHQSPQKNGSKSKAEILRSQFSLQASGLVQIARSINEEKCINWIALRWLTCEVDAECPKSGMHRHQEHTPHFLGWTQQALYRHTTHHTVQQPIQHYLKHHIIYRHKIN